MTARYAPITAKEVIITQTRDGKLKSTSMYDWNAGPVSEEDFEKIKNHQLMLLYPKGIYIVRLEYRRSRYKWTAYNENTGAQFNLADCIAFKVMRP